MQWSNLLARSISPSLASKLRMSLRFHRDHDSRCRRPSGRRQRMKAIPERAEAISAPMCCATKDRKRIVKKTSSGCTDLPKETAIYYHYASAASHDVEDVGQA
jgi:hypothetical protein